ncbi:MAG: glycosyltransferase family 4 protein [Deltaproteobacteria bacterium]
MTASHARTSAVLVSPWWPPESAQNGVVSYLTRLLPELGGAGVDARLLAGGVDDGREEDARRAGVRWLAEQRETPARWLFTRLLARLDAARSHHRHVAWQISRALEALGRERRIDVYELEEAFGWGRHVRRVGRQIVRLHGPWFLVAPALGLPDDAANRSRMRWEGAAIARADAVSSPSRSALDAVRRHYGAPLPEAVVIPNATPIAAEADRWSPGRATPRSILFVGRFDRLKGADLVLEAFARLHAEDARTTLTFVGPDRGLPGALGSTTKLAEHAERHLGPGARAQLRYLGSQPASVIAPLRATAAVTVVASRFETFGMTLIEAMAAGSPVVAARAGALPEILAPVSEELLFRSGDADELADRVRRLFDRPEHAAALGARGREECERRYAPAVVARATADFYRGVAHR